MERWIALIVLLIWWSCPYNADGMTNRQLFPDTGIVIVDVTDRSLARYGRWPWPRDLHGKALEILNLAKIKGVYFDFIFSESDVRWPEKDLAFSESIRKSRAPVFLPYAFLKEGGKDAFPYSVKTIRAEDKGALKKIGMQVLPPLANFAKYSAGIGYVNYFPDQDHVLRELPIIVQWQGQCYGHMGLVIAAHLSNTPFKEMSLKGRSLLFGSGRMPLKRGARIKPVFSQKDNRYAHFHYSDLLDGKLKRDIQGKFVIMGFNATGMSDYVVTESSNRYPGSEVIASVIDHIMVNMGK